MRRREFIAVLGSAAASWPLAARAQQSAMPVVGVLASGSPHGFWAEVFAAFRQGLGDLGYSDGRNVTIEARWAEEHYGRLPALMTELIERRPALIVALATQQPRLQRRRRRPSRWFSLPLPIRCRLDSLRASTVPAAT